MMKTVGGDLSREIRVETGHEAFFAGLIGKADGTHPDERTGEALRGYVCGFLETCDLEQFRKAPGEPYSRIYLGRDERTGWEAIMMCWEKGSETAIHGHPGFAAYNFASGRFRIEMFEQDPDRRLCRAGIVEASAGDGYFAIGRPDRFDNHIHRITCLSNTGHSLHIYCGDARKGVVFGSFCEAE